MANANTNLMLISSPRPSKSVSASSYSGTKYKNVSLYSDRNKNFTAALGKANEQVKQARQDSEDFSEFDKAVKVEAETTDAALKASSQGQNTETQDAPPQETVAENSSKVVEDNSKEISSTDGQISPTESENVQPADISANWSYFFATDPMSLLTVTSINNSSTGGNVKVETNLMTILPQSEGTQSTSMLDLLSGKTWNASDVDASIAQQNPRTFNLNPQPQVEVQVQPTNLNQPQVEVQVQPTNLNQPQVEVQVQPTNLNQPQVEVQAQPTNLNPQPQVEVQVQPTNLNQPQVEVQAQPTNLNPQPQVEVQAQPTNLNQPQVEVQAQPTNLNPQPQVEVQAQPTNLNPQPQVEVQAQPTNLNPQPQVEVQAQPTNLNSQPQVEVQAQPTNLNPQPQVEVQAQPTNLNPQPQVEVQAQPTNLNPQPQVEVQAQPTNLNPQPQVEVQAQPTNLNPQPQVEVQAQPTNLNQPQVEVQAQPTNLNQPQVEVQAQPTNLNQPQVEVQAQPTNLNQPQVEVQAQPTNLNQPQVEVQAQPTNLNQPQVEVQQQFGQEISPVVNSEQPQTEIIKPLRQYQVSAEVAGENLPVEESQPNLQTVPIYQTAKNFDQNPSQSDNFQQNWQPPTEGEVQGQSQNFSNGVETFSSHLPTNNNSSPVQQTVQPQNPEAAQLAREDFDIPKQIVEHARMIRRAENTEMIINLKPEHLGSMTLKISVSQNGTLNATFYSDNAQVRAIIENSLVQLKQELSDQGLKVENVEVYAGLSDSGLMNGKGQQAWQQNQPQGGSKGRITLAAVEKEIDPTQPVNNAESTDGVDYKV